MQILTFHSRKGPPGNDFKILVVVIATHRQPPIELQSRP